MAQGGYIAPDGRPPQAPGVGKDSKRHDLEAPATPGVRNSDMRQGDRQMLEAGQRVAPRPKKSAPKGKAGAAPAAGAGGGMQIPDAIEFASGRIGGNVPAESIGEPQWVDPRPWMPLLQEFATRPVSNPKIAAAYVSQISKLRRQPYNPGAHFVDMNEADDILEGS